MTSNNASLKQTGLSRLLASPCNCHFSLYGVIPFYIPSIFSVMGIFMVIWGHLNVWQSFHFKVSNTDCPVVSGYYMDILIHRFQNILERFRKALCFPYSTTSNLLDWQASFSPNAAILVSSYDNMIPLFTFRLCATEIQMLEDLE